MNDADFDAALVAAVLSQAGERGWRSVSIVTAARDAGLDLGRTRQRFPGALAVLLRFGAMADQSALAAAAAEGPVKDRLFDMMMQRFDALQAHRAGVLAVLDAAATDPLLGLMLAKLSTRSMGWLLEAAGVSTSGLRGTLRVKGLLGVWLWGIRAWRQDESTDLSSTMTAVDAALDRAGQAARWIGDDGPAETDGAAAPETAIDPAI